MFNHLFDQFLNHLASHVPTQVPDRILPRWFRRTPQRCPYWVVNRDERLYWDVWESTWRRLEQHVAQWVEDPSAGTPSWARAEADVRTEIELLLRGLDELSDTDLFPFRTKPDKDE